jgi:hypothetical protein
MQLPRLNQRPEIPFRHQAAAYALDQASELVNRSDPLFNYFMRQPAPSQAKVRWRAAQNSTVNLPHYCWAEMEGDENSGRLASNYASVGLVGIDQAAMDAERAERGGVDALAYPIGHAVMVGTLPYDETFGVHPDYPGKYLAGAGIGAGTLWLAMGRWHPESRQFTVPDGVSTKVMADPFAPESFPAEVPKF